EGGAQGLVAAHDLAQGALHHFRVELAVDPERLRDVVFRALRLEVVEEPEALLRKGERKRLPGAALPGDARRLRRPLLLLLKLLEEQCALFRRQLGDAAGE